MHAVRCGGGLAQHVEVVEVAPQHIGAGGGQGRGRGVRAGETDDLMAGADEFGDDGGADPAGRTGNENPHDKTSRKEPSRRRLHRAAMSVAVIRLSR